MNYDIKKRDGKIHVTVTLNSRGVVSDKQPREKIRKQDVDNILISENIKYGECVEDPGTLTNFMGGTLTKTWVFEAATPRPRTVKKPASRPRKSNKTKKSTENS